MTAAAATAAAMSLNHAVVVIKGHAGNDAVKDYVLKAFEDRAVTVNRHEERAALDVLENTKITRLQRMAFSYLDTVHVFDVTWDISPEGGEGKTKMPTWVDFREKFIGDNDTDIEENKSPEKAADKKSIRAHIAANHKDFELDEPIPSAENNIIYCSPSAIAAAADRIEWFDQTIEDDPLLKGVARDTENGYDLARRLVRNVYLAKLRNPKAGATVTANGLKEGNAFDLLKGFGTAETVAFIKSEEPYFEDCIEQSRQMTSRRSTVRVSGEAPIGKEPYQDKLFIAAHSEDADIKQWIRIGDLFPAPEDGALLPNDATTLHFGQSESDESEPRDCTLLAAVALLVDRHPQLLENLFVSKEVRPDGHYTFQFYRWDRWEKVEIDDAIPCDSKGKPVYSTSPTGHWWPLLLEKAYAKLYGSYGALHGGQLSEALHDLTAKPVESFVLTEEFVEKGATPDFNEPSFWLDLFEEVKEKRLVLAIPASHGGDHGLETDHGYAVLEVKAVNGGESVEDVFMRLHNPFAEGGAYNGDDEVPADLPTNKRAGGQKNDFWVSVATILEITETLLVCRIKGVEDHPFINEAKWEGVTAGGPPSSVSWRNNPIYTFHNKTGKDIKAMVILKQRDQRHGKKGPEASGRQWRYLQCGLVCVRNDQADTGLIPTPFITNNLCKAFHRGVYLNQREVCDAVTFTAKSLSYIVPSALEKGEEGEFLLAVYVPQGTNSKDISVSRLHCNADHAYPLRRPITVPVKGKGFTDLVLHADSEVHCLLRQHKDKSMGNPEANDVSTDVHVAISVFDANNEKVAGMSSGLSYKENAVIARLPAGRYHYSVMHAKGAEPLEGDLFFVTHPDAEAVVAPHRDFVTEEEEKEEMKDEIAREEAERARRKAEAEKAKAAKAEAEARALAEEKARAEKEIADAKAAEEKAEADAKAAEEAERQRKLDEEAAAKKAAEEEAAAKAKAAADKEAAEKKAAADAKAAEEEAERQRKEKEEADAKAKAKAEADAKREAEEKAAADAKAAEEEAERQRAKEKADADAKAKKDADEKAAADAKAAAEADEAAKAKAAAEKEAADKAEAEEKQRAADEAAKKKQEKEEKAAAAQRQKEADAEEARRQQEEKETKERAKAEEKAAAEEQKRRDKEAAAKAKAEEKEAAAKAKAEEKEQKKEEERRRKAEEDALRKKLIAERAANANRPPPRPPAAPAPTSPRAAPNAHYLSATKASKAKDVNGSNSAPSGGAAAGAGSPNGGPQYSDKAPKLPSIHGFGSSSPRMVGNYRILPYIQKYEEGIY